MFQLQKLLIFVSHEQESVYEIIACVQVHRNNSDDGFTEITLTGSEEQRKNAEELINELTSSDDRRGYRSGKFITDTFNELFGGDK